MVINIKTQKFIILFLLGIIAVGALVLWYLYSENALFSQKELWGGERTVSPTEEKAEEKDDSIRAISEDLEEIRILEINREIQIIDRDLESL